MAVRRNVLKVQTEFLVRLQDLEQFDRANQIAFTSGASHALTKSQMTMLTETIFFNAFREYENFLNELFLLYCMGKKTSSGAKVRSFLRPKDTVHAAALVQSSLSHLDWTSPGNVIARSETYLLNGFPIKDPLTTNLIALQKYKKIRNHIAHGSAESLGEYKKVVKDYYGTMPLTTPPPGEYLMLTDQADSSKYLLLSCFETFRQVSSAMIA